MILLREVSPRMITTLPFGTPTVLATKAISAALALPSTGGAEMRISTAPSRSPIT
jgi:hypothetical protein